MLQMQRTSLWYIDVQRVKFVVYATYFTVVHRCKNILKSKKMKIVLVKTNLKITLDLKDGNVRSKI